MNETIEKDLTILFTQAANILESYKRISLNPSLILKNKINEEVSLKKEVEREVYNHYEGNYDQILEVISTLTTKKDLDRLFAESIVNALENNQVFLVKNRIVINLSEMLADALDNPQIAMLKREIKLDIIKTIIYFLNDTLAKHCSSELETYLKLIRNNLAFLYDDIDGSRMPYNFIKVNPLIWQSPSLRELYGLSLETYAKITSQIVDPLFSFALYNLHSYYEENSNDEEMNAVLKIIIRVCLLFYGVKDMARIEDIIKEYQDHSEDFNNAFTDCLNSFYHDKLVPTEAILGRFR